MVKDGHKEREREEEACVGPAQHLIAVGLCSLIGKAFSLSSVNCFPVRLQQVPWQEKFPLARTDMSDRKPPSRSGLSRVSHPIPLDVDLSPLLTNTASQSVMEMRGSRRGDSRHAWNKPSTQPRGLGNKLKDFSECSVVWVFYLLAM